MIVWLLVVQLLFTLAAFVGGLAMFDPAHRHRTWPEVLLGISVGVNFFCVTAVLTLSAI